MARPNTLCCWKPRSQLEGPQWAAGLPSPLHAFELLWPEWEWADTTTTTCWDGWEAESWNEFPGTRGRSLLEVCFLPASLEMAPSLTQQQQWDVCQSGCAISKREKTKI